MVDVGCGYCIVLVGEISLIYAAIKTSSKLMHVGGMLSAILNLRPLST